MTLKGGNTFGAHCLEIFDVGDCVSFNPIRSEKIYGIITEIYTKSIENDKDRFCAFANVRTMHGRTIEIILSALKLESKVKRHEARGTRKG